MASKARAKFEENSRDIDRLMEIHRELTGKKPGRRHQVEVLNKSAIVLITAVWEAFCEDLAAEGVEHLVNHAEAKKLPKHLRTIIGKELKESLNEQAVWDLADDGWRDLLSKRLDKLTRERNFNLNTPKADQIEDLFEKALGIKELPKSWTWSRMRAESARKKLNAFVKLRGDIAHRGAAAESVTKTQVTSYQTHIGFLVDKTEVRVRNALTASTGQVPWT